MLVLIMTGVPNQHHSDLWQHPACWAKVVLRDSNTITNIVTITILIIFGSSSSSSSTGFQLCHVTSALVSAFLEHAIIIIIIIITIINIIILFIFLIILLPLVNVVVVEFNISTLSTNTNSTVLLFYDG